MSDSRLGACLLALLCVGQPAATCANRPNVVLFFADDLGWTDWQYDASLNPTGSLVYETPNLMRLAGESVQFTNGYSASPVCSPSRAALLTGKTPARLRVTDYIPGSSTTTARLRPPNWRKGLATSEVTLAESLGAAGYRTGFFGKWHLGLEGTAAGDPLQHGFGVNVAGGHHGHPGRVGGFFAGNDGRWQGMPGIDTPGTYAPETYISDAISSLASDFIGAPSSEPFFLMMSEYLVHTPIEAPQPLVDKYANKIASLQAAGVNLRSHNDPVYAGMVEKMDDSLGVLLDRLEDPNGDGDFSDSIRDDTLILFASDNGGLWASEGSPTRNLPLREGKGSAYEGGIRTPLMVSWTGESRLGQGVLSDQLAITQDLYTTALDAAGVLDDPSALRNDVLDGVSLLEDPEAHADRSLLWHYPHLSPQHRNARQITGGSYFSALRQGDWKLIFRYDDEGYELYNLKDDLAETTNVLSQNWEVAGRLSEELRDRLVDADAQLPIDRFTNTPVDLPTLLPETLLAGDFNLDGRVDAADYTVYRDAADAGRFDPFADANSDLVVDAADLAVWRANFGASLATSQAVPEPTAFGLVFFPTLFAGCRRSGTIRA